MVIMGRVGIFASQPDCSGSTNFAGIFLCRVCMFSLCLVLTTYSSFLPQSKDMLSGVRRIGITHRCECESDSRFSNEQTGFALTPAGLQTSPLCSRRLSATSHSSSPKSTVWRPSWKNSELRNNALSLKMSSCAWSWRPRVAETQNTRAYRAPSLRQTVRYTILTTLAQTQGQDHGQVGEITCLVCVQRKHRPLSSGTTSWRRSTQSWLPVMLSYFERYRLQTSSEL